MRFSGKISTVKCFENNPLVRKALEEDGHGRVLVVDGGGSLRCALLGDNIAEMAYKNGWDVRVMFLYNDICFHMCPIILLFCNCAGYYYQWMHQGFSGHRANAFGCESTRYISPQKFKKGYWPQRCPIDIRRMQF